MTKVRKDKTILKRNHPDFGARSGYLVHDVSRLRRTFFDEKAKPYGLTRSQYWVLVQLSRRPDQPMSQVELAEHLDIGKAGLGRLVDRLQEAGYVHRKTVAGDRRVNHVAITPKGLEIIAELHKIGHALNVEIFSGLTDEQVHEFEEVLSHIKRNLRELS
jgi:MarR family transcriptional regulator for hemolysin